MKCDRCLNDATIHVAERRGDGTVVDVHLCADCADRDNVPGHTRIWSFQLELDDDKEFEEFLREIDDLAAARKKGGDEGNAPKE
ncbi:MAG TPA: hypothetical protein VH475_14610 [Tepidisphaeraceae bacterium]|jgi:protein-arginine kinase activator protein McsA